MERVSNRLHRLTPLPCSPARSCSGNERYIAALPKGGGVRAGPPGVGGGASRGGGAAGGRGPERASPRGPESRAQHLQPAAAGRWPCRDAPHNLLCPSVIITHRRDLNSVTSWPGSAGNGQCIFPVARRPLLLTYRLEG